MRVPLPVCSSVVQFQPPRDFGGRVCSFLCLAILAHRLAQAPDPEHSPESFSGVCGRGSLARVLAGSGESLPVRQK